MLALDDLLGLLGHTIELDVLGSLLKIKDLKVQTPLLVLDSLEAGFELTDQVHQLHLFISSSNDLSILVVDHVPGDEDCILVVGGNR